ncbi:MAG: hypothetical protein HC902_04680, partial [Calothrix sp. SM1_5_4]|nr:hypothetical protein [Calothrix sp. SM1_5_4]
MNKDGNDCTLYREVRSNVDVSSSDASAQGVFSLKVGGATPVFVANGGTLASVFANKSFNADLDGNSVVNGSDSACGGFTPASGTARLLRVSVRDHSAGGLYTALTPDTVITSVPSAMVADSLQGKAPADFVQIRDDATNDLSQTNLEE